MATRLIDWTNPRDCELQQEAVKAAALPVEALNEEEAELIDTLFREEYILQLSYRGLHDSEFARDKR